MTWQQSRLSEKFAIELTGIKSGPSLTEADCQAVYDATVRYGVCVLPGQSLTDDQLFDFAASLEDEVIVDTPLEGVSFTRVMPLGNVGPDGNLLPGDDWVLLQNLAVYLASDDSSYVTGGAFAHRGGVGMQF